MDGAETFHVVEPDVRQRAAIARLALAAGHHAEVYASLGELGEYCPAGGLALVRCDGAGNIGGAIAVLRNKAIGLPVIATAPEPDVGQVVRAIRAGALDFLALPASENSFHELLGRLGDEAGEHLAAQRRLIEARKRVGTLTRREREVLDWLTRGQSNKAIAQTLRISPRTVEIHRANMMAKLGARHPAEAVRIRLDADG
ncbi:helix-turn-helix transcriptional regulator [Altererythrobacter marinus]|uniref:Helix-turn-helix transcriptional regulator n=1 Tax=Pelagerythrobacter marinus TaxID=538382 RepID=A0ABW9UU51_9SPHN|nr:LuxR C-terminal-related transcriptional regulator [Pelagerythrobacter marinus]MXO67318.1 helix-turn-helix transcriptional regulator [Pelagerythrobacter marinus]